MVPALVDPHSPRGSIPHGDRINSFDDWPLGCRSIGELGVLEYWIFDPYRRKLLVLQRVEDRWEERELSDGVTYQTELLPDLMVSVSEIFGAALEQADEDEDDGTVGR